MPRAAPHRSQGIATVEFAISAPLLCLLVVAVAEVGRAFVHHTILSYCVRDAVRFVTENAINGTTGVVVLTAATTTAARNLAVYGNVAGNGAPRLPAFAPGQVTVASVGNDNIRIVATYPYQPMIGAQLPGFGFGPPTPLVFNMQIAVTMRAIS